MVERQFLLNKMPKGSVCAEIGAWKGDFTRKILDKVKPKKLYLIDPYLFIPEYTNAWYGGVSGSQENMDKIYNSVRKRFENESSVEFKREYSKDALNSLDDLSLDWVYIDGNHLYEYVKSDLVNSWTKVKVGGFVTGDDYNLKGWWSNGVKRAVDEFINSNNVGEVHIKGTQFIIEKKG